MFFSKPVLAVIAVFFLGSISFALLTQSKVSVLQKQNGALKAQLVTAKKQSSSTSGTTQQFKGLSGKLDQIIKNQAAAAKQQPASTTPTLQQQVQQQDGIAQSNLKSALKDANKIYAQSKDYAKVTPAAAKLINPDLTWSKKTSTAADNISVAKAKGNVIDLCALSDSGTFFCLENDKSRGGGTIYGQGATQVAAQRAFASDGWNETSGNTTGQTLPFKGKTTPPVVKP